MKFKMKQRLAAAVFEADEEGRLQEKYESVDADALHPLVLAYVGDAYFHLFVRTRLLRTSVLSAMISAAETGSAATP